MGKWRVYFFSAQSGNSTECGKRWGEGSGTREAPFPYSAKKQKHWEAATSLSLFPLPLLLDLARGGTEHWNCSHQAVAASQWWARKGKQSCFLLKCWETNGSPTDRQNLASILEHCSFCRWNWHPGWAVGTEGGPSIRSQLPQDAHGTAAVRCDSPQWFAADHPSIWLLFIVQDTYNVMLQWMYFTVMPDQKCCLGAILAWENPK